ncbi:hypothetical protein [uncultured Gammaproteobacteria bacterium]|uniref:DUF1289 domain-containing protein n=1 Tax=Bathymodiolus heckerae thiotrophic gill symbiont TaxID=1052212 RepID=UPI0010B92CE6|nr:DUF1289 domain-containing protein [Bathymodiolus heckerae thiotrophic gill symbiont]CAC9433691.1 hypothetical protein [uncultured Gammaproteobacteria bacterium]SMN13660.1 hypothetical protein BHECKSOX2_783 [Bathymodiolus heckerae thiotrophic gill symbiont]SMN15237.1 hypothetical protein CRYPD_445 [uncultured Candidatus Thioglobus sp.]
MSNQTVKTPLSSGNSPCVGICKYNKKKICVGCKRSSDEITAWINCSNEMRKAIMQDLKDRNIDN